LDPRTGELVEGGLVSQVERVLDNLAAVLEAAGGDLSTVVKTTVYLADMGDFATVNRVYAEYFGESRPARATIQAAGLPKGVAVEVDAIGRVKG
jgi:2-iminobutanoate/2-iminopropanoate deaminase